MKTLSSDKRISRLAYDSLILATALILSYVEAVIPILSAPFPGFKLGLCNIAIMFAAFKISPVDAAVISSARVLISFLLFGNPTSLLFSLFGSALVIAALFVLTKTGHSLSFIGISVICAFLHNTGQMAAALILTGKAVLSYTPFLCLASLVFGTLNGVILNLISKTIFKKGEKV